jgi:poly(U)-specific endoribonuclease
MLTVVIVCVCSLFSFGASSPALLATDAELWAISEQIWQADANRIDGPDVQYNINGPKLYTYVNEARFVNTYVPFLALLDNYTPETGIAETCGSACTAEQNAFLDAILTTQPIQLLYNWLLSKGLAGATQALFKEELRQYWFMPYTRSGGPLDSSGFEHIFVGEIKNGEVSGSHNWVNWYYEEKAGNFVYGPYLRSCNPEILTFSFHWLGYNKPISGSFMRTSPEVEIALGTLCLVARMGPSCPIQLSGYKLTMTAWDMTGLPTTIGSAYPNC